MCVAKKAVGDVKCPAHVAGKKGRFVLGEPAFFIPAVKSQSCHTVFCDPFLLESAVPEDLLSELQGGENTTRGWASILDGIEQDQEEDQDLEVPEADAADEDLEDDSPLAAEASESELEYPEILGTVIPKWSADVLEVKEDSKEGVAILELGRALAELYDRAADLSTDIPAEGRRAVMNARSRCAEMKLMMEEALESVARLEEAVGNTDTLVGLEFDWVKEGLLQVQEKINSVEVSQDYGSDLDRIRDDLSHLVGLQEAMVQDFSRELDEVGDTLVDQVVATDRRVAGLERAARSTRFSPLHSRASRPAEAVATIGFASQILDLSGHSVGNVGELFVNCQDLSQRLLVAENRVRKLEADVVAQGGLVFGGHTFTSEVSVREMVAEMDPTGESFAAFCSFPLIFCHDPSYSPSSEWFGKTKHIRGTGNFTESEARYLNALTCKYPAHYAGKGDVKAGKVLMAFASEKVWSGDKGMIGQQKSIEDSLFTSLSALRTHTEAKLPPGKLKILAESMASATDKWVRDAHHFFSDDLKNLSEVGLSKVQVLVLISEYLIIISDVIWTHMQKVMQFTINTNMADFTTRVIWVNLLVHQEMAKFTEGSNMKYNPQLGMAYQRFLTKEFGQIEVSKILGAVDKVESSVKAAVDTSLTAKKAAADAKGEAHKVSMALDGIKTRLGVVEKRK